MDFTKKYIKKCEKAIEVQKKWKGQWGDYIYDEKEAEDWDKKEYWGGEYPEGVFLVFLDPEGDERYSQSHQIWLPRQDQLQEMLKDIPESDDWCPCNLCVIHALIEDIIEGHEQYYEWSMEELWLAFVMKKKYNKIWNGEDWVLKGD